MNRLAAETSPYLLQHADNPVDWYPWGDEAFALARAEDRPILLSVGYAACHWCHVMEHESFEDEETAALMNRDFVPVKVDREERPDVDGLYMDAVVAPDRPRRLADDRLPHPGRPRPSTAGRISRREPRHGMPSFSQVLQAVAQAYEGSRRELEQQARCVAERSSRRASERPRPSH